MRPNFHAHTAGRRHIETAHEDIHPASVMILLGDALHNFVDGVFIATVETISGEVVSVDRRDANGFPMWSGWRESTRP